MMKYSVNHPDSFSNPFYAFLVALMQSVGGLAAEIVCITFLCSLSNPIDIIIRFVAFASIGKIDNFYAAALPDDNKIKKDSGNLTISNHRRDLEVEDGKKVSFYGGRFVYKTIRIAYASFIFYFLPYLALFIPQFCDVSKITV